MPCVHVKQLIQLCETHQLRMSGADMIHFVCQQCGVQEVCPDMLIDEYDRRHLGDEEAAGTNDAAKEQAAAKPTD